MGNREVSIRKVDNGYVIKTTVVKQEKKKNVEAMINLMRAMGMYESWQEHREEEIRRSLEKVSITPFPEREEREIICSSIQEVAAFIKDFFEREPSEPISL